MSLELAGATIVAITPVDNGVIAHTLAHFHPEKYLASHGGHMFNTHAHTMKHHKARIMHDESLIPRSELEFIFRVI